MTDRGQKIAQTLSSSYDTFKKDWNFLFAPANAPSFHLAQIRISSSQDYLQAVVRRKL